MGISWGFLVALWFTSSRGKAMDNWCYVIWDFPGLRLPEAYVRLLSCSHQPDMKRWKDRKVKERTSMDSKQQLLTQLLLTQFFGGWTIESWKKPWLALAPGITRLVAVISRIRALEAAHCDRKMACIYILYNIIYIYANTNRLHMFLMLCQYLLYIHVHPIRRKCICLHIYMRVCVWLIYIYIYIISAYIYIYLLYVADLIRSPVFFKWLVPCAVRDAAVGGTDVLRSGMASCVPWRSRPWVRSTDNENGGVRG